MKTTPCLLALLAFGLLWAKPSPAAEPVPETIPLQVRENLRIVYQVTDDLQHEGVNKGLFYARKLINTYEKQGIAADQVKLHLVYHGTGINAVVNPEARSRLKAEHAANPNGEILAELTGRGVQIELCENTMQQKGVKATELMPGVKLVVGAFPRLVDLQLMGYAYIKFE
ncbi:DsrE family protein [Prosthecobacter sp. SYSU 5D2]|uniref:DsrE family protein n=1 Tax=Prosthecobacter sp. SYSU 5D2 TaxID=3134134 RepID=UPI0031FEB7E2